LWKSSAGHRNGKPAFREEGQNGIPDGLSERETRDRRGFGFEGPPRPEEFAPTAVVRRFERLRLEGADRVRRCSGRGGIERNARSPGSERTSKGGPEGASALKEHRAGPPSASARTGPGGHARAPARARLERWTGRELRLSKEHRAAPASASAGTGPGGTQELRLERTLRRQTGRRPRLSERQPDRIGWARPSRNGGRGRSLLPKRTEPGREEA
jgi:hypothetical protein